MIYRAVGNICAVNFDALKLKQSNGKGLSKEEATSILRALGFQLLYQGFGPDKLQPLLYLIDSGAKYRRGARMKEVPYVFDCSSLVKWFYSQYGIWVPRRSIQQHKVGISITELNRFSPGDLILTESNGRNYYETNPEWGIGHVSIATGAETVIHASRGGIRETDIAEVRGEKLEKYRGARRIVKNPQDFYVFRCNPYWEVETSDDIGWIILQNLNLLKEERER